MKENKANKERVRPDFFFSEMNPTVLRYYNLANLDKRKT